MGRITSLRDLIGAIKDRASQTKAAIKTPTSKSHQSLLRATTHDLFNPPNQKHLATLLSSAGDGSRATASAAIDALMDRLQTTHDSSVALKCLIVVHTITKRGSFILQDQLSVYPSSGGRNYLKLSDFMDGTNPVSWEHSCWVRWYARYLELLIYASKVMGFFLCSSNSKGSEKVPAMVTADLVRETDSLVGLIEEITKKPESLHLKGNLLTAEIIALVGEDYLSAVNEVSVRIDELKNHRKSCLSFGDSVELVCVLKRLLGCREKLGGAWMTRKRVLIEEMWVAAEEVLEAAEEKSGGGDGDGGGRFLLTWGRRRRSDLHGSESARFGGRVLSCTDSVKVSSSARFGSNRYIHDTSLVN